MFKAHMIEIFLEHTPPSLGEIQGALAKKEYLALAKIAHRIKPSIESMGITQLNGVARDIELAAKADVVHHDQLAEKVRFFNDTLLAVLARLEKDHG